MTKIDLTKNRRILFNNRPTLSIIVPFFNEERTILKILGKIHSTNLPGFQKEIILVDDGSTDKSSDLIRKESVPASILLQHENNRGKGAAIRTALPFISGQFVIIQDADLEYDPSSYARILQPLTDREADAVYGSRFLAGKPTQNLFYRLGNMFLTRFTNLLFNASLTDIETCYKAFHADFLRSVSIQSDRFDFDPEITAIAIRQKLNIVEVPITYRGRSHRDGKKITPWDGCMAILRLIRCRLQPPLGRQVSAGNEQP